MNQPVIHKGLEGIYVDKTAIANIDGEKGSLHYRDRSIESCVNLPVLQVVRLLIGSEHFIDFSESDFTDFLSQKSTLTDEESRIVSRISTNLHPMKVLQGMVPLIDLGEFPHRSKPNIELLRGLTIAAKLPTILSAYHRLQLGKTPLAPQKDFSLYQNFLFTYNGRIPSSNEVSTLNKTQILQLEHGFNASTFAARVTASTLAPIESALSTAIGTLYGPLHGGADEAALKMAIEIGSLENVESYVDSCLRNKKKIMGMGHRVYRVVDPRAKILKPLAKSLCQGTPYENLYDILEKVEATMEQRMLEKGKLVKANVEFYKGPVLYALGFTPNYFTAIFALSRVFGYIAHILESRIDNRIIRPKGYFQPLN